MALNTTPATWSASEVPTSTKMNTEIRDAITGIQAAWTSYTPTLTQSATLTKTVTYAKYMRIGKTIYGQISLAITSAGTASNVITFGLPVTAAVSGSLTIGSALYTDASPPTIYSGNATLASTTTGQIQVNLGTSAVGINPAVTAANGDTIFASFMYEAA